MNLFVKNISVSFCLLTAMFGVANAASNDCDAPFEEENGLLVVEVESVPASSGWKEENSMPGFTGGAYYEWTGGDNFSSPGNGVIEYQIKINNPGTYHFRWHNKIMHGTSTTESNDSWLRIPDADDFFARNGTSVKYPNGGMFVQSDDVVEGSSSDGWMKVYCSGTTAWTWSARTSDNDAHEIYATFNEPGVYTVQISGRSNHHAIDRFVLFQDDEYSVEEATDLSNEETVCPKNIRIKDFSASPGHVFLNQQPIEISFSARVTDEGSGSIQSVSLDLSEIGGGENVTMNNPGDIYTYDFTIDGQEIGEKTIHLTAEDDEGNIKTEQLLFFIAFETAFSINCGGDDFMAADGVLYKADHSYSGGDTFTSGVSISGTNDDLLYQSERYGNFSYDLDLPNGTYDVTLKMAETYFNDAGSRIFDVSIEGVRKIENIDIYEEVGTNVTYDVTFSEVEVSDKEMNIQFTPEANNATISALNINVNGSTHSGFLDKDNAGIDLYPNPVANVFHIESKSMMERIEIFDMKGNRIVNKQTLDPHFFSIDVGGLKNGLYLLRVYTANGVKMRKIYKQ